MAAVWRVLLASALLSSGVACSGTDLLVPGEVLDGGLRPFRTPPRVQDGSSPRSHGRPSDTGLPPSSTMPPAVGDQTGPSCDVTSCPVSDSALVFQGPTSDIHRIEQSACCVGDSGGILAVWSQAAAYHGQCGVVFPDSFQSGTAEYCEVIIPGVVDHTCLDTVVDGERVQGCRRPDGKCGHLTPGWGCHLMDRSFWDPNIDDAHSGLPNPFTCKSLGADCTRGSECCFHPAFGGVCLRRAPEDSDAGDEDGGAVTGYCTYLSGARGEPAFPEF
jgi:hypothetical protein